MYALWGIRLFMLRINFFTIWSFRKRMWHCKYCSKNTIEENDWSKLIMYEQR